MHTPGNDFLPRKVDHPLSKSLGGGLSPSEVPLRVTRGGVPSLLESCIRGTTKTKTETNTKTKIKTKTKTTTTKTKITTKTTTKTKTNTSTNTNTNTKTQTNTHSRRWGETWRKRKRPGSRG